MKQARKINCLRQGVVDRTREHFVLHHFDRNLWGQDHSPVALVGPPESGAAVVQYLVETSSPEKREIVSAVDREINFYLLEKGELNPWGYAIHHCGTFSNAYSMVHWSFIDPHKGARDQQ